MELSEEREQSANQSVDVTPAQTAAPSPVRSTGTTTPSYVYALGRVKPRFPSLAVEKEFAQITGRAESGCPSLLDNIFIWVDSLLKRPGAHAYRLTS